MPNWSYNKIGLQGSKETVQKFINLGLENSDLKPTNDIRKDFELLVNDGKTKKCVGENGEPIKEVRLTARTFLPMPDTFILYNTTNHPNKYPIEIVKEQAEKYGAVGWYDYNIKTLGTKWNFNLEAAELREVGNGKWRIVFDCETAWSAPTVWCETIKSMFPELKVFIAAHEESNAYIECGEYCEGGDYNTYSDYTGDMNNMYEEYDNKRDEFIENLRNDKEKMEAITENVRKKMADENREESEEVLIQWELESLAEDELGDWCDDEEDIYDNLHQDFYAMMDEKI